MESFLIYIDEKLRKDPGPTGCLRIPREACRLAEVPGLAEQDVEMSGDVASEFPDRGSGIRRGGEAAHQRSRGWETLPVQEV